MSTRSWNELVTLGRKALAKESGAQWALGDLALELEPVKIGGGAPGLRGNVERGIYTRLHEYAQALGTSYRSLVSYRSVAHAWPKKDRVATVCFGVHAKLAPEAERVTLLRGLVDQAAKENRTVSVDDALIMRGKEPRKMVPVSGYERGRARVTPIRDGKKPSRTERRRLLEALSDSEIGDLIEQAWAVLEARAREAKAA